jgi:hypothetical protein
MSVPAFPPGEKPWSDEVADWVECSVLASDRDFKRGDLKSAISREDIDNPDLLNQQVWAILQERDALYTVGRPVVMDGDRIRKAHTSDSQLRIYRYLCLLGLGQLDPEDRKLFEELVGALLRPVFGENVVRIGHPASSGLDPSFRSRVETYASQSGLIAGEVGEPPFSADKDLGLDVISWWPWEDRRGGNVHFLIQCATGRDWKDKLNDVSLNVLKRHLNWSVPPVRVFSVPKVIQVSEDAWLRLSDSGGLILDRPRLLELSRKAMLHVGMQSQIDGRITVLSAA